MARIHRIEIVADVIVGRDCLDPEQCLAVRPAVAFVQCPLERQERRALHEKYGKRRQSEIGHPDIAGTTSTLVRKPSGAVAEVVGI